MIKSQEHQNQSPLSNSWLHTVRIASLAVLFSQPCPNESWAQESDDTPSRTQNTPELKSTYHRVTDVHEAIASWAPDRQLFISGDVGLSDSSARQLAENLRAHPNWTVYLLARAEGTRYTDKDGHNYRHHEAVEHALGKELSNNPAFSAIAHPKTGEQIGNILAISLDDNASFRRAIYRGADGFDKRQLGEANWRGDLDQLAIRPLKDGRRVYDAVLDTVRGINSRLDAAIIQEEAARLKAAENLLNKAESELTELNRRLEDSSAPTHSELKSPQVHDWTERLHKLRQEVISPHPGLVERLTAVDSEVSDWNNSLERYESTADLIERLRAKTTELSVSKHLLGKEDMVKSTLNHIEDAEKSHKKGERQYLEIFETASKDVEMLDAEISAGETIERLKYLLGAAALVSLGVVGRTMYTNRRQRVTDLLAEVEGFDSRGRAIEADLKEAELQVEKLLARSTGNGRTSAALEELKNGLVNAQDSLTLVGNRLTVVSTNCQPDDIESRLELLSNSALITTFRSELNARIGQPGIDAELRRLQTGIGQDLKRLKEIASAFDQIHSQVETANQRAVETTDKVGDTQKLLTMIGVECPDLLLAGAQRQKKSIVQIRALQTGDPLAASELCESVITQCSCVLRLNEVLDRELRPVVEIVSEIQAMERDWSIGDQRQLLLSNKLSAGILVGIKPSNPVGHERDIDDLFFEQLSDSDEPASSVLPSIREPIDAFVEYRNVLAGYGVFIRTSLPNCRTRLENGIARVTKLPNAKTEGARSEPGIELDASCAAVEKAALEIGQNLRGTQDVKQIQAQLDIATAQLNDVNKNLERYEVALSNILELKATLTQKAVEVLKRSADISSELLTIIRKGHHPQTFDESTVEGITSLLDLPAMLNASGLALRGIVDSTQPQICLGHIVTAYQALTDAHKVVERVDSGILAFETLRADMLRVGADLPEKLKEIEPTLRKAKGLLNELELTKEFDERMHKLVIDMKDLAKRANDQNSIPIALLRSAEILIARIVDTENEAKQLHAARVFQRQVGEAENLLREAFQLLEDLGEDGHGDEDDVTKLKDELRQRQFQLESVRGSTDGDQTAAYASFASLYTSIQTTHSSVSAVSSSYDGGGSSGYSSSYGGGTSYSSYSSGMSASACGGGGCSSGCASSGF